MSAPTRSQSYDYGLQRQQATSQVAMCVWKINKKFCKLEKSALAYYNATNTLRSQNTISATLSHSNVDGYQGKLDNEMSWRCKQQNNSK
jgi:hypothetical protein